MMYIDFSKLFETYNSSKTINGIIHVGACTGEEREAYANCGVKDVLWFEANPETFDLLKQNISQYPENKAYNSLLSDEDDRDVNFYVTTNFRAASSSMLRLAKHLEHYPKITVDKTLNLKTKRFDTFAKENAINLKKYNFLNMDVQGAELKVLRGIGDLVKNFDYVYSEINIDHLYENCALLPELEDYLEQYGFVRKETNMTKFDWGDAIFVKKEICK